MASGLQQKTTAGEGLRSMSIEMPELEAFYHFAQRQLRLNNSDVTLEDVLREFRKQEDWIPRTPLGP